MDISNPNFICGEHRTGAIPYRQAVKMSTWDHEYPEVDSHQAPTNFEEDVFTLKFCKYEVLTTKNPWYIPQIERFHIFTENQTHNLCIVRHLGVPLWY